MFWEPRAQLDRANVLMGPHRLRTRCLNVDVARTCLNTREGTKRWADVCESRWQDGNSWLRLCLLAGEAAQEQGVLLSKAPRSQVCLSAGQLERLEVGGGLAGSRVGGAALLPGRIQRLGPLKRYLQVLGWHL